MIDATLTLEQQKQAFEHRRFLAMPLAGTIAWAVIGLIGAVASPVVAVWAVFIGSGSTVYLGMALSKFTGEDFLDKSKPKNTFDRLFFMTIVQALAVYAIAIPFFLVDYTSLPMTVGILTGLMWIPFSWLASHWIGLFHGLARAGLVVAAWYLFPDQRFVVIPFIIVAIYLVTIVVLEKRARDA
ncbi:hypothetical protein F3N42_00340 [Marinihelvus fidelis]|uniref:Uncharacterized protein n=1 Tax=Marinihelvus fidelis TaxID=2613842 RepID=A0A5N0THV0_9GAMM|nr:hypothetical protein [Marinihelvus fidelis]KAA9134034.1 hypothetical protein F3N42_00340 [Marinihelvus fidelis]